MSSTDYALKRKHKKEWERFLDQIPDVRNREAFRNYLARKDKDFVALKKQLKLYGVVLNNVCIFLNGRSKIEFKGIDLQRTKFENKLPAGLDFGEDLLEGET